MKRLSAVAAVAVLSVFASLAVANDAAAQTSSPTDPIVNGVLPIVAQLIFFAEAVVGELLFGSRSPLTGGLPGL